MRDYSRTELTQAIDEWIHNEKHRQILKFRLLEGYTYEAIGELCGMSPRQIKRIVYKTQETLFRHI